MTQYDYRVIPAPKQVKRVPGARTTAEAFAMTLAEAINAVGREGWEYVRAESLPAAEPGGWFRRGSEAIETVLIFRRPRETLGPRLAAAAAPEPAATPRFATVERPLDRPVERAPEAASLLRREPRRVEPAPLRREPRIGGGSEPPTPLRPGPRVGPGDEG